MVLRAYDHGPPGMKGSPVVTLISAFRSGLSGPAAVLVVTADPELRIALGGFSLYVTGEFVELDRPRRLRFTWNCSDWADPSVQSQVTVTLEEHGGNETMMTIEHEQLPPEQVSSHRRGWGAIADQLGEAPRDRRR